MSLIRITFITLLLSFLGILRAQSTAYIVDATQGWQATGVNINAGESMTITCRGVFSSGTGGLLGNPNAWSTADGWGLYDPTGITGLMTSNAPAMALVGKIGINGTPFGIGTFCFYTSTVSGELYLAVNDKQGTHNDNYGYLVANITANTVILKSQQYQTTIVNLEIPKINAILNGSSTYIVDATQDWQATGVNINAGESMTITCRGVFSSGTGGLLGNPNAWSTADGWGLYDPTGITGLMTSNAPAMALVGKIGINGTPFGIGTFCFYTSTVSGELYLAVNDKQGTHNDNYGYLVTNISAGSVVSSLSESSTNLNKFELNQNFPNPFNPTTQIKFGINEPGSYNLKIFNIGGELVREYNFDYNSTGEYTTYWDGKDNSNNLVSSGTYFYQLSSNNISLTKKMLLLK